MIVVNARSGDGKATRFRLAERAEGMGTQVRLTSADHDAASLARLALQEGAEVLGVAGGDGTVAAVAAVAADADRPLVVVPAGTRNHFARDLGLDIRDPVRALSALCDGEPARVDLGLAGPRVFINNVSLGAYADALLEPGYREAKARVLASVTPGYLTGQHWVEACVDTPQGTIDSPQVVLVSNNPYHLATPRYLGRRFALTTGMLGGIVLRRPPDTPPDLLRHLRRDLRRQGDSGRAGEPVVTWTAAGITVHSGTPHLHAGIDGEPVVLPLPVTCQVRPGGLRVLLPRNRPGIPREPAPARPGTRRTGIAPARPAPDDPKGLRERRLPATGRPGQPGYRYDPGPHHRSLVGICSGADVTPRG
ncbi:diacylglycerol/lipid kinase family protein [Streptomyces rimosus]|uniref:diacylglycerol/lipid kinase family protein n=1 Tax=Streptomyces rimosus TaxID=1927 RepID=UPI0037A3C0E0